MNSREEHIFWLRDKLYARGYTFRRLAIEHGYTPAMVRITVRKYWKTEEQPQGVVQRKILRDLKRILKKPPSLQKAASA